MTSTSERARIAFVLMEHGEGLSDDVHARYEHAHARITSLVSATVEPVHYERLAVRRADALVLSGSYDPWSCHDPDALLRLHATLDRFPGPVLGICAGMQVIARARGGEVAPAARPTRGWADVHVHGDDSLLGACRPSFAAFADHRDEVVVLPLGMRALARSSTCAVEAVAAEDRPWWGTQFHPELWDDAHPAGRTVLQAFFRLAGVPLRAGG